MSSDHVVRVDLDRLGVLLRWASIVALVLWFSGVPAVGWLAYRLGYTAAVADAAVGR